ncbi:uncharacterized protein KIAA0040 homolog [Brachyhypopomus gauderio]|uniref:uncharacterized protein KIAA0040 homolog n=1 Tax=Brachyhypopomus gauderio TaxID=698409 RepID=UPI0040422415
MEQVTEFFGELWALVLAKHGEGVYNTVCLAVLLALPLVVITTLLLVCCHCCCGGCCACCRRGDRATIATSQAESKRKKKRNVGQKDEDLWISVKTDPLAGERMAFTVL